MFLHEIVRALERLEQGQREILAQMAAEEPSRQGEGGKARADEWIQNGIDNILAYEAGKKKEG